MTHEANLALCGDCHANDGAAVCYCAMRNSDGTCDGFEPEPSTVSYDLRELSHAECAARGIKHSSEDHNYTALSDADTDEHCRQALRSAARRCGL
jgi:hypothetical protein